MPEEEPKDLPIHPEGYHDTGEFAYDRDLDDYIKSIFRDSSDLPTKHAIQHKPAEITPDNPSAWSMRHYYRLEHYLPADNQQGYQKDEEVEYAWDWKEATIFGGLEGFFSKGAVVLDLGSGMGKAVDEINEKYSDRGVKCFGVDYRFHRERPENGRNHLIGGHFRDLPFKDGKFDRILSQESFPAWLPPEQKTIDRYFQEITRVSREGTIWRGTFPYLESAEEKYIEDIEIIRGFTKNGWEVVFDVGNRFFIARLTNKN
jgi:SAM-dependent methyltransferase